MRPRTASMISGSASMVEHPLSSLRAPWLETMIASMPASAASTRVLVGEYALDHDLHMPTLRIFWLSVTGAGLSYYAADFLLQTAWCFCRLYTSRKAEPAPAVPAFIMIEVNERIEVPSAPRIVWDLLSDPRAVVACVPGAALGDEREDGSFDATLIVKFGPAKVTFRARVTLDLDTAAMVGHVTAKGKDNQGGTRVRSTMTFRVMERAEPPGSTIPIEARVEISGRLATLVEGGATRVVKRMTGEFSERLAARCAAATAS